MTHRNLKDQVIFITGASGGLGEQISYLAAQHGATVILAARRQERLLRIKERCASYSGKVFAYQLDISDRNQVRQVIKAVYTQFDSIDILVNNAGFGFFEECLKFDINVVEKMFQVNVLGLIQITKLIAEKMAIKKQGHIINIASQGGKIATPKSSVYSATKSAVVGFSNALRLELQPLNIYVTTVNPGPIRTAFFDKADKTGKYLSSIDRFVMEPEYVAKKIIKAMKTKKREVNIPVIMEIASRLYNLFPHIGDYLARTIFNRK